MNDDAPPGVADILPAMLHELRNPLAAIMTAAELVLEETSSPEQERDLRLLLREGKRMDLAFQGFAVAARALWYARESNMEQAVNSGLNLVAPYAETLGVRLERQVERLPRLPYNPIVVRGLVINVCTWGLARCKAEDAVRFSAAPGEGGVEIYVEHTGRTGEVQLGTPHAAGDRTLVGLLVTQRAVESVHGGLQAAADGTALSLWLPVPG